METTESDKYKELLMEYWLQYKKKQDFFHKNR